MDVAIANYITGALNRLGFHLTFSRKENGMLNVNYSKGREKYNIHIDGSEVLIECNDRTKNTGLLISNLLKLKGVDVFLQGCKTEMDLLNEKMMGLNIKDNEMHRMIEMLRNISL